jgi:uncharacterized protein (TIGR03083 family)
VNPVETLVEAVAGRAGATGHPIAVGIAGAVSVGKSTFAEMLAGHVRDRGHRVEVVSTDGFLFPTAALAERGILARKGFPESYDVEALRQFVIGARRGDTDLHVPRYSHETYDIDPLGGHVLAPCDVLLMEGLNAIGAASDLLDLRVYLDAAEADLERWYLQRFAELVEEGRHDPASFYASMAALGADEIERLAHATWVGINLVNLREHIAPTRALADLVAWKGPDHSIVEVREHARMPDPADVQLVDLLEEVWGSMVDLGAQLADEEWTQPTEVPGWTVQDNLVHITGIEARLLGHPDPDHSLPADLPHVKNDFGRSNEIFVDSRRSMSGAEAFEEFRQITGERLAVMHGYRDVDFATETWTPVGPGTVRDLLPFRIFDSWVHEQDMRRAVGRPGDLDSPVATLALERIVSPMPYIVAKKAGAPEGATVVFDLSGPLARRIAITVDGGRARFADAAEEATTTIAMDTETFARLGCGRMDGATAIESGAVRLDGDQALGRRVVEAMNFLF